MSESGSNSVVPVMSAARPLFPRKRTSIRDLAMSHSCQARTHAVQQTTLLFDHPVGEQFHRIRYLKAICAIRRLSQATGRPDGAPAADAPCAELLFYYP